MSKERILEKTSQIKWQYDSGVITKEYHDHILEYYYDELHKGDRQ